MLLVLMPGDDVAAWVLLLTCRRDFLAIAELFVSFGPGRPTHASAS
ncbi:hypothetical protein [Amycolatopsis sp. lyj-23]